MFSLNKMDLHGLKIQNNLKKFMYKNNLSGHFFIV